MDSVLEGVEAMFGAMSLEQPVSESHSSAARATAGSKRRGGSRKPTLLSSHGEDEDEDDSDFDADDDAGMEPRGTKFRRGRGRLPARGGAGHMEPLAHSPIRGGAGVAETAFGFGSSATPSVGSLTALLLDDSHLGGPMGMGMGGMDMGAMGSSMMATAGIPAPGTKQKPRPEKGKQMPTDVTRVLQTWLIQHADHPYPTPAEKTMLMAETGMTPTQLRNFLTNYRKRHWKPVLRGRAPRSELEALLQAANSAKIGKGRGEDDDELDYEDEDC